MTLAPRTNQLPGWDISIWLNSRKPISLESLRGKVVVIHAFQMLCPGCVSHGLPQAERIRRTFREDDVSVVGLHTVFEHHEVMTVDALRAFIHEYRWSFPIGVDRSTNKGGIPRTMAKYGLHGTPTLIVLDREGIVRLHRFGQIDDLPLGALLGQLLAQGSHAANQFGINDQGGTSTVGSMMDCDADRCATDVGATR
jgi:peroxiredoxin